jgi:hypothetical protein
MGDQVLVAPPGITRPDQFAERNTQPMPPRAGNSLIVGGPAYFTPEGYQAPYQPEQSFMPTNVAPDPIRDQFNRMYPTPPPPPPAPAPAPAPTPVYEPVVEPVAGPDPVTEPVVEPVVPPGAYPPYIPGVTPFPGIPGLGDLDFSGLPGMGDIDIDRIIQEYQDRQNAGEPEPFDSFLPTPPPPAGPAPQEDDPLLPPGYSYTAPTDRAYTAVMPFRPGARYAYGPDGERIEVGGDPDYEPPSFPMGPPMGPYNSNTSAPEPEFVPPPQEPNGFFPGINPEDFEDFDFGNMDFSNIPNYQMPAPEPENNDPGRGRFYGDPMDAIMSPRYKVGAAPRLNQSALDRLIAETESLNPGMGSILNRPSRVPFDGQINEAALQAIQSPGSKDFRAPRTPQAQAPAPVYTPPPSQIPMQGMMDDYDYGNPNLRNMRRFDPRR